MAQIANYATSALFTAREKVALRYADAITWDPTQADDAMWVELGVLVGVPCGGQRWMHTLDLRHGDVATESTTGCRPELTEMRQ